MGVRVRSAIEVIFPDSKAAEAAAEAVLHEGNVGNRSKTDITRQENSLRITIEAEDVVAFRATANAFLRALQVFEGVEK